MLLKFNPKISTGFPLISLKKAEGKYVKPINADAVGDDGDKDDDDDESVIKVHSCRM